jgi:hypothetical protein
MDHLEICPEDLKKIKISPQDISILGVCRMQGRTLWPSARSRHIMGKPQGQSGCGGGKIFVHTPETKARWRRTGPSTECWCRAGCFIWLFSILRNVGSRAFDQSLCLLLIVILRNPVDDLSTSIRSSSLPRVQSQILTQWNPVIMTSVYAAPRQ